MSFSNLPRDVLGEIASYSQVPRMRRVSRESEEAESTSYLRELRRRNMDRRYPIWQNEGPINMAAEIGLKGSIDDWQYYMRNSPAFMEFIEQYLPYVLMAYSAILNDNLDLLLWLLDNKIDESNRENLFTHSLYTHYNREILEAILLAADSQLERSLMLENAENMDMDLFEDLKSLLPQEDIDFFYNEYRRMIPRRSRTPSPIPRGDFEEELMF